jgi:cysteine-rich repeat protein
VRHWTVGIVLIPLLLGCDDEQAPIDEPSPCVGGQYCVGTLVCVGGFCVQPDDTGDLGDDNASESGDGDGDMGESMTDDGESTTTEDGESTTTEDGETTTDDGETEESETGCELGSEGCPCLAGECDATLSCIDDVCVPGECGDGVVNPGEGCDDGNGIDDDACTNACSLASCGDGRVQVGESCDDGDADETDACLSTCVAASCGDGFLQAGVEDCDDQDANNDDECLTSCEMASCGDGFVYDGVEECDDQNLDNDDACVETCLLPYCGDGYVQYGMDEECDDQNANNNDGCVETCLLQGCGDGFLEPGEQCDDGLLNGDDAGCTDSCVPAVCGDGLTWVGVEDCDDQNDISLDGCEAGCEGTQLLGVVTGNMHTCVLVQDGSVRCWGDNTYGQLGVPFLDPIGDEPGEMPPPVINLGGPAVQITSAANHICALMQSGAVRCWGRNSSGQLGIGSISLPNNNIGDSFGEMPPDNTNVGGAVAKLVTGLQHTCALMVDGNVRCWGDSPENGYPNEGPVGSALADMPPGNVSIGGLVLDLSAGGDHNCVLRNDGSVRCWGDNEYGQLGIGSEATVGLVGGMPPIPSPIGEGTVSRVAMGYRFGCALFQDNTVRCWGANGSGQLGHGNTEDFGDEPGELPPPLTPIGGTIDELKSAVYSTCALMADATLRCWGSGVNGLLGNGLVGPASTIGDQPGEMPPPVVNVGGLVDRLGMGTHSAHACVVLQDQSLRCWGRNHVGQLGYGNLDDIGDQPGEMPPPPVQLF